MEKTNKFRDKRDKSRDKQKGGQRIFSEDAHPDATFGELYLNIDEHVKKTNSIIDDKKIDDEDDNYFFDKKVSNNVRKVKGRDNRQPVKTEDLTDTKNTNAIKSEILQNKIKNDNEELSKIQKEVYQNNEQLNIINDEKSFDNTEFETVIKKKKVLKFHN